MTRPVDALIEFLQAEQARGVSHVLLDDEAREGLRNLYRAAIKGSKRRPAAEPRAAAAAPEAASAPATMDPANSTEQLTESAMLASQQIPHEGDKTARLEALRQQAAAWTGAKTLGTLRETLVFSTGNPDARLMLIGEAPGYEEERRGEPFVGPAGQKLTDILKAMGLARSDVYLSNIVKYRPAMARQATNNRKPSAAEMAVCMPWIEQEISIVQPAAIVALGGTAAEGLLKLAGAVGAMRGSWHEFRGIPVRVTYHPSYLLRNEAAREIKRQLWEDMLAVMEKLQIPISEAQQRYFLPKS
ncbi:MAG: uracil-DNA glycosylase [Luteolibacter sp.]